MSNLRFYLDTPLKQEDTLVLPTPLAHRLIKVLRLKTGTVISLFNSSQLASAQLIIDNKLAKVIIGEVSATSAPKLQIEIGQVMPRKERMDIMVQKAAELGASVITPLRGEFCEVKLAGDTAIKRQQKWQDTAIAASEQSESNIITTIAALTDIAAWLKSSTADLKLVLDPRSSNKFSANIVVSAPDTIALLVGSEGGLAPNELAVAEKYGFKRVALGRNILRAETAPIVALSVMQYLWGW